MHKSLIYSFCRQLSIKNKQPIHEFKYRVTFIFEAMILLKNRLLSQNNKQLEGHLSNARWIFTLHVRVRCKAKDGGGGVRLKW